MKRWILGAVAVLALAGCSQTKNAVPQRLRIKKISDDSVQFIPQAGQLPYCLIFTRAKSGTLRQLTMTRENKSVRCPAGEPVLGLTFKLPPEEGQVKVLALFSSQRINAGSIAEQLFDNPNATALDLRLPGNVVTASLQFTPKQPAIVAPVTGTVVGKGGVVQAGGKAPGAPQELEDGGTAHSSSP